MLLKLFYFLILTAIAVFLHFISVIRRKRKKFCILYV